MGESSYNTIEFARRHNLEKFQIQKARQEEIQKNIATGLNKLEIDLKGWNDKSGFNEVMSRQDKAYKMYFELAKQGINFNAPKTTTDIMAFKTLTDYQKETQELADLRNNQKIKIDTIIALKKAEALKDPEEQGVDWINTDANLAKALKDNTISGRDEIINNALVPKVRPGDVVKQIIDDKGFYIPTTQTQVVTPNPETGANEVTFVENMPKEDMDENVRRAGVRYTGLTESMKKGVRQMREAEINPSLKVMSDKDYYATLAVPTYRKKFIEKAVGTGGGLNFNFLGSQAKIVPGEFHTNDDIYGGRNYNQRYDFSSNKSFNIPTTGGYQHTGNADPVNGTDGWEEIKGGDIVEGTLRFYDPKTDQLIFHTNQQANTPWVSNNTTIAVPRKNIPDAENLPIKLSNGKMGKLKDILPKDGVQPSIKQLPGIGDNFWSKNPIKPYIPKSK